LATEIAVSTQSEPEELSPWMSYEHAAAYAGYDRVTLWRAVKRGELRVGGLPGAPRFHRDELDRWLRGDQEK
jgi:hypothetical protein